MKKARELQKAANALASDMMRADGLDPAKDQRRRAQYYMRARERLLLIDADCDLPPSAQE